VLGTLHDIHPTVALAAINAVLGGSTLLLVGGLLGLNRRRRHSRRRALSFRLRLRRLFR
jgi:hypothetical protein